MSKPDSDDLFSIFRLSTGDLIEQTVVLLEQEDSPHYKCRDYLRLRNGSSSSSRSRVSAEARAKVARWLADIVDYFSLQRQTVAMAMSYVDIFLSLRHEKASEARRSVTKFQLLALVCLSIATKALEVAHLDVDTLVTASQGCYSADDIRQMEIVVLNALQWRLCAPTTLPIAHRVIALLAKVVPRLANGTNKHNNSLTSCLVEFTRLQLELAVTDYTSSVLRKPSTVAIASILNSMDLLDFDNKERRAFGQAMTDLIGLDIHSVDVAEARAELNEIFDKQSEDVMSRASVSSNSSSSSRSRSSRSCRTSTSTVSTAASTTASSFASTSYHSRNSMVGVDEPIHKSARKKPSKRSVGNKSSRRKEMYHDDAVGVEIPRASELLQGFGQSRF